MVSAADTWMRAQDVVNPVKYSAMLVPGFAAFGEAGRSPRSESRRLRESSL